MFQMGMKKDKGALRLAQVSAAAENAEMEQ
jgi:hypothetical protein